MFRVDEILSNVVKQTLTNKLNWKHQLTNRHFSVYVAKKLIDKDKYLTFFLNVYYIGSEVDYRDIVLRVEMTTSKRTIEVDKILAEFYPKVGEIYQMVVNEIL